MSPRAAFGVLLLAVLLAQACASPFTVIGLDPLAESSPGRGTRVRDRGEAAAETGGGLSERSLQTLRQRDLSELWEAFPELVLRALNRLTHDSEDGAVDEDLVSTLAELTFVEAQRLEEAGSVAANGYYLYAASLAYRYLVASSDPAERAFDTTYGLMNILYRRAAGGYLHLLFAETRGTAGRGGLPTTAMLRDRFHEVFGEGWRVRIERRRSGWNPSYFDDVLLADGVEVRGLRNHYVKEGLGVPLVGIRENRGDIRERYFPPSGVVLPVTAVIRFDADDEPRRDEMALFDDFVDTQHQHTAVITFHDPHRTPALPINGRRIPLAADFTAPYALLLERSRLHRVAMEGLLEVEKAYDFQGLYMHEPYSNDKIPVLMVHGLRSAADVWAEMTNDLYGDAEIRRHFQIWHYVYPTAMPYLYTSVDLRRELEGLRILDPEGEHRAQREMIIIAHSMGGLVARPLVTRSGRELWNALMHVPPEEVRGSPADVERVRQMMIFEPFPAVRRIIFISTPHRGSRMADSFFGRVGSNMINLPENYVDFSRRIAELNADVMEPEIQRMSSLGLTSIKALSPRNPVLQVFSSFKIDLSVKAHTIIGDRDVVPDDPEKAGDGVVTHESAHLPEEVSELFVPGKHDAYSHPLTILEVKRILREHLNEDDTVKLRVEPIEQER